MTRDEVFEGLHEVFWDVFDDEDIQIRDETTANDIEDWDSLEHIIWLLPWRRNSISNSIWEK